MNYSIKNFIKNNCCSINSQYGIDDLSTLANKISTDSKGEYTEKGAMKILCKYVCVIDDMIRFDPNSRNSDQSFDSIKLKLSQNLNQKTLKKVLKEDKIESKPLIPNKEIKKVLKEDKIVSKPLVPTKEIKTVTKGGFGKFGTVKQIINDNDSIDTKPNNRSSVIKSEIKPMIDEKKLTRSKGGFGTFRKKDLRADSEKEKEIENKVIIIDQDNIYKYPTETKYQGLYPHFGEGVVRTDTLYGPYGVDNFYDSNIRPDILGEIELYRVKIYRKLASLIYPAQRSDGWFRMRDKMITASDGGTIVGLNPYEHESGFISKKVHGKPFDTNIDCYHGKKYEQVATMIYELRMNVMVKEFGLCQHPKYDFLGASPDGIVSEYKLKTSDGRTWNQIEKQADNDFADVIKELDELKKEIDALETNEQKKEEFDELSKKYTEQRDEYMKKRHEYMAIYGIPTKYVGRMLEIKCPRTRAIIMDPDAPEVYGPRGETIYDLYKDVKKGICPAYYWVQVQLQLQCCELNECDFWQCTITEYSDKNDFIADTDNTHPWLSLQTKREKGAVIQLIPRKQFNNKTMDYNKRIYNFAEFIHQPRLDMTPCEIDHWISDTIQNISQTHCDKDGNAENDLLFERVLYWKLDNSRNITIPRDDKWFADNLPKFKQAWNYVKYFRNNKDHSNLLKKFLDIQPKTKFGKLIENEPGFVMSQIHKLYDEPTILNSKKEHQLYQKFIQGLIKETIHVPDPKVYNIMDDVNHIKNIIDHIVEESNKCTDKNETAKLLEIIKSLKFEAESNFDQFDLLNL